jgi:hypothetical protein
MFFGVIKRKISFQFYFNKKMQLSFLGFSKNLGGKNSARNKLAHESMCSEIIKKLQSEISFSDEKLNNNDNTNIEKNIFSFCRCEADKIIQRDLHNVTNANFSSFEHQWSILVWEALLQNIVLRDPLVNVAYTFGETFKDIIISLNNEITTETSQEINEFLDYLKSIQMAENANIVVAMYKLPLSPFGEKCKTIFFQKVGLYLLEKSSTTILLSHSSSYSSSSSSLIKKSPTPPTSPKKLHKQKSSPRYKAIYEKYFDLLSKWTFPHAYQHLYALISTRFRYHRSINDINKISYKWDLNQTGRNLDQIETYDCVRSIYTTNPIYDSIVINGISFSSDKIFTPDPLLSDQISYLCNDPHFLKYSYFYQLMSQFENIERNKEANIEENTEANIEENTEENKEANKEANIEENKEANIEENKEANEENTEANEETNNIYLMDIVDDILGRVYHPALTLLLMSSFNWDYISEYYRNEKSITWDQVEKHLDSYFSNAEHIDVQYKLWILLKPIIRDQYENLERSIANAKIPSIRILRLMTNGCWGHVDTYIRKRFLNLFNSSFRTCVVKNLQCIIQFRSYDDFDVSQIKTYAIKSRLSLEQLALITFQSKISYFDSQYSCSLVISKFSIDINTPEQDSDEILNSILFY